VRDLSRPVAEFQDGTPLARGVGTTTRRTMPVAGTAHGAWFFWDGRADSQWAQALGPLESAVEHGGSRAQYAHVVAAAYRDDYEAVFGPLPRLDGLPTHAGPVADTAWRAAWERIPPARQDDISRVYANIGKAIAAYERRLGFAPSRFDRYVDAELAGRAHTAQSALSDDEVAGLRLFIGKGSCVNCHNGPRFTDDHFHNTGVPRARGLRTTRAARSACARPSLASSLHEPLQRREGPATATSCASRRRRARSWCGRTRRRRCAAWPSARPYMHAGQLATLADVVAHYDRAPHAPAGTVS
jgi:cytochrome c peroxidase